MAFRGTYDADLTEAARTVLLKQCFAFLKGAQKKHERCDEVDALQRRYFIENVMPKVPAANEHELVMIEHALAYNVDESEWKRVNASLKSHPTVSMFVRETKGDSAWGKAFGDIDDTINEVFAWVWQGCSYERMQTHREKNGELTRVTDASDTSRTQVIATEMKIAPGLKHRWSVTMFTWSFTASGDIAVAFEPTARTSAWLFTDGAVEAKHTGLYTLKKLASRITTLTLVQKAELGGAVSQWLMMMSVARAFALLLRVQEKFRRRDKVVDKEGRDMLAARIRGIVNFDVPACDKDVYDSCLSLKNDFEGSKHLVKILMPTSPFVEISMSSAHKGTQNTAEAGRTNRRVATGKAVAEIDTSLEEVVAWTFDYCSRERMRINLEDNKSLPRVILRRSGMHSLAAGSVKAVPFPFSDREFVGTLAWFKVDPTRVVICLHPLNELVDYGQKDSFVRGSTSAFWEVKRNGEGICSVIHYQRYDLRGFIPVGVVNKMIRTPLKPTSDLRATFQRDEMVDAENRRAMVAVLVEDGVNVLGGGLAEGESAIFDQVAEAVTVGLHLKTTVKGGADLFVKVSRLAPDLSMGLQSDSRRSSVGARRRALASSAVDTTFKDPPRQKEDVFIAELVVDAEARECVAWQVLQCSRQRKQSYFENDGGAFRAEHVLSTHRREVINTFFVKHKGGDVDKEVSAVEVLWKRNGNDSAGYVVVEQEKDSEGSRAPRLHVRRQRSVSQEATRPSGPISSHYAEVQEWTADMAIDYDSRNLVKEFIRKDDGNYTAEEKACFGCALELEEKVASGGAAQIKAFKTPNSLLNAETAYVDNKLYGRVNCVVHASLIDVLACFIDNDSRLQSKYERGRATLERKTLEVVNYHRSVFYLRVKVPPPFQPREFIGNNLWRKESEKEYFIVNLPGDHESAPPSPNIVRAESVRAIRLTEVSPGRTQYMLTFTMDMKGFFPTIFTNSVVIPANFDAAGRYQKYFMLIRPMSEFDEKGEDAAMLAQLMLDDIESQGAAADRKTAFLVYFIRAESLRFIAMAYPWFSTLLWHIIESRSMRTCIPCSTTLNFFTLSDASSVGSSFDACLRGSLTPELAVDAWLATYSAMGELDSEFALFRPLVARIAKFLLEKARNVATKAVAISKTDEDWEADAVADQYSRSLIIAERILKDDGMYTDDEKASFERCRKLERMVADSAAASQVRTVKTKNTLIEASTSYSDEAGFLIGRATCVIRASSIDVLARYFDSESKVDTKYDRGSNTLEKKSVEIVNNHHQVSYLSVRLPLPFQPREFLGSVIWRKEEGRNEYLIVNVPADHDKVPLSTDVVRAESVRAIRLREEAPGVTRYTITFTMNLKGNFPLVFTNTVVIPANLEGPAAYQKYFMLIKPLSEFDRGGEDAAMLAQLMIDDIESESATANRKAVQQQYFDRAVSLRFIAKKYHWSQLVLWHIIQNEPQQTSTPCSSSLSDIALGDASSVGRSFAACLRGSVTPLLAVNAWFATYPAMGQLAEEFPLFRPFVCQIAKHLFEKVRKDALITCVCEMQFEPLVQRLGSAISQTKVTAKFTLGKRETALTEEERVFSATKHFSELRTSFDKSVEIDKGEREKFCGVVKAEKEKYDENEEEALKEGLKMFSHFEGLRATTVKMGSPITISKVALEAGDSAAWGWAYGIVRADAIEILAYLQDTMRRAGMRADDIEKTVDEMPNNHNRLIYNKKRTPKGIDDRDFLGRQMWRAVGGHDKFEIVTVPEESMKRSSLPGVARGKYPSAWKVVGGGDGDSRSRVEYVVRPDWGGDVPSWISNLFVKGNLARVTEVQDYFQGLCRLLEYDEKDGAAVGERFMIKMKEEREKRKGQNKYHIRVSSIVNKHVALKELTAMYPWFPSLVEGMLQNWLVDPVVIRTKLDNLSSKEAYTIGKTFALALFDRQAAGPAVDMFCNEYVSLVELTKKQRFFEAMAVKIGQRKLEQAPWGLIFKVGTGAVLGVLDVATDIYAIINFTMQGQHEFAKAVVAMVSVSMVIQVLMVYANGSKRGVRHVFKEALVVFTGFKSAVDAFRVISGVKAGVDDLVEPLFESILSKVVEVVTESIPSALVQIYAVLASSDDGVQTASIMSIVISIATIAFATKTNCFDFYLDTVRLAHAPDFYGYNPNTSGKRTVVFFSMLFFTACHVWVRLLGIALLAVVNPTTTAVVLAGDMLFFLLFKIARNDLRYWLRLDEVLSWVTTIVIRVVTKLMVDFTVMVQLRRTYERPSISQACSAYLTFLSFSCPHLTSAFQTRMRSGGCTGSCVWYLDKRRASSRCTCTIASMPRAARSLRMTCGHC